MRLQVIGEQAKAIGKINPQLYKDYPGTEWHKIIRLRDLISHHYDDIDHEIVYQIVIEEIPNLEVAVKTIISDLTSK